MNEEYKGSLCDEALLISDPVLSKATSHGKSVIQGLDFTGNAANANANVISY